MVITIMKSDEDIRNECKNLWNQTIDIDWLKEFYRSFIKWNREDTRYPRVTTYTKDVAITRVTASFNDINIDTVFERFDTVKEKVKEIDDKMREEYWDRYIWITASTLYCPTSIEYRIYQDEEDYVKQYIRNNTFEERVVNHINKCIEWFSFNYINDNLREMFMNWDITLVSLIRIVRWDHVEIKEDFVL